MWPFYDVLSRSYRDQTFENGDVQRRYGTAICHQVPCIERGMTPGQTIEEMNSTKQYNAVSRKLIYLNGTDAIPRVGRRVV